MNNDLISRSALIETINKISFYSVHNGEFIEGAGLKDVAYYRERDIYRAIIDAPTVEQPKGKWVSITERLPEEEGDYLLWGKIDENEEDEYSFIGSYDEGFEQFGIWHEQFDSRTLGSLGSEFYAYSKVVAWQPLPKPYKEGGDV